MARCISGIGYRALGVTYENLDDHQTILGVNPLWFRRLLNRIKNRLNLQHLPHKDSK